MLTIATIISILTIAVSIAGVVMYYTDETLRAQRAERRSR